MAARYTFSIEGDLPAPTACKWFLAKLWTNSWLSCSSLACSGLGGSAEGSSSRPNTISAGVPSSWPNIKSGRVQELESFIAENIRVSVYGALGDSVHLHFNTTLNSSAEVQWKRGVYRIGVFKNNSVALNNPYINRAEIFANGTLRLDRTQKDDSGDYSVDVFNTDGTSIFKRSMQVYIQGEDKAIQVRLVYGSLAFVILTIFPITLHCNSWKSNSKGKQSVE
ncbi:uncharacterized protein LOC131699528 [Acipenser ruthenus]|uniref:uncharacterized protein LOC131699528 n=1 Tax=Acipenser ruthenus TaxID=7906 RepID=UPI002741B1CC|nr:uncharacterized protein LOC131699528 [Acipenser ruthenus]